MLLTGCRCQEPPHGLKETSMIIPAADQSPMCPHLPIGLIGKQVGETIEIGGREIEVVAID
jgi:hypothetical protein